LPWRRPVCARHASTTTRRSRISSA
jgi:hypothetical protein